MSRPALRMEIKGLKQVEKTLQKLGDRAVKIIEDENTRFAENVEDRAIKAAPANFGNLRSSISREVTDPLDVSVGSPLVYAPFIEFGTGRKVDVPSGLEDFAKQFKGTGSGSFDKMVERIEDWMNKKGIDGDPRFMALSILKNGIEPHPYLFPAVEIEFPDYLKRLRKRGKKELEKGDK